MIIIEKSAGIEPMIFFLDRRNHIGYSITNDKIFYP
jgi:hypothetical protein